MAAPASGTLITASAVDNSGLGYDLDLYFFTSAGAFVGQCSTAASDESCRVPAGAQVIEVAAFSGVDLDVTVTA